jgi:hypothetical protein
MHETLAWLRNPETEPALSDLLCGLVRDIRLILVHPDLGNAAKLGAIAQTVDQLAPPPGPQDSDAPTAASVAALLARSTRPADVLFEELAGEQIRIELISRADRRLTVTECFELHASPGMLGHQRTGTLRTANTGLVAAEVSSLVVPDRLPAATRKILGIPGSDDPAAPPSDVPLGKALADLGVHREPLGARMVRDITGIQGSGVWVESSARIWLGEMPVALASERVTVEFCRRARDRRTSRIAAKGALCGYPHGQSQMHSDTERVRVSRPSV